ncbi:NAD dependent epimerase/dehydratase [Penicillium lagena]|uniref:NAD dependent epimerase/dehydratase n=1 Tax=Penicillium lagena TaxID=94218 RepID=UPI0025408992|nr:NAD dependent epimerase/dehydratase [Penicillium lagena]KAJ5604633.1 NAD dependent epimerase/dehydratase [Penicillium lagena]
MAPSNILLTGATGFIGGTVLHRLLDTTDAALKSLSITAVVRRPDQADLLAGKGVQTVLVNDLGDADRLEQVASSHDIVVNVASGHHSDAPKALIRGLQKRREETGADVHFLHLSGTTNIAASSITQSPFEVQTFSDKDNIYEYELLREANQAYGQRTADVNVIQTGESANVKTYIVMPPSVYGRGDGWFKRQSHQIPTLIRNAITTGYSEHLNAGTTNSGHVHVADLSSLYALLLEKILSGVDVPFGRNGYYFSSTGSHSWLDVTTQIGKIGFNLGALQSATPRSISLEEAAVKLADGDTQFAEACFSSNSSTKPEKAYELGWKPTRTERDFEASIQESFEDLLAGVV